MTKLRGPSGELSVLYAPYSVLQINSDKDYTALADHSSANGCRPIHQEQVPIGIPASDTSF